MALVHSNDRAGGKSPTGNGPYTLRQRTLVGIPPFDPATHRARYRDAIGESRPQEHEPGRR